MYFPNVHTLRIMGANSFCPVVKDYFELLILLIAFPNGHVYESNAQMNMFSDVPSAKN